MVVGLNLYKRLLTYLASGIFFGLMFTFMFSYIMKSGYIFGFLPDTAITGSLFAVLFGAAMEISRKRISKKFQKVRLEIGQSGAILMDSLASHTIQNKGYTGWLFLTDGSLIFCPHKDSSLNLQITIPVYTIQNVNKLRAAGLVIMANNTIYNFAADKRDKWFDVITDKISKAQAQIIVN